MILKENITLQTEAKGGPAISVHYGTSLTPFGQATLFWDEENALCGVQFGDHAKAIPIAQQEWGLQPIGNADPVKASRFIELVLGDSLGDTITLRFKGTPFQISIWKALIKVPFAETWTYQELARHVGNEKAVRAVGTAVSKNPLPLVIPCHRIVRFDGFGNYSGGKERKLQIIEWEKQHKHKQQL